METAPAPPDPLADARGRAQRLVEQWEAGGRGRMLATMEAQELVHRIAAALQDAHDRGRAAGESTR
jgi:hypothetical protein